MFLKKFDFVTVGGATRDFMFYDPAAKFIFTPDDLTRQKSLCFEYGAKIELEKTFFTFGGGAANAAVNFSLQGFKTGIVAAVGEDENGEAVVKNLAKRGVDVKQVQKKEKKLSGFSFILTAGTDQEHVAFLYRGANNELTVSEHLIKKIKTRAWYVSSLSGANWRSVVSAVFSTKAKVTWNPGGRQLAAGYRGLKDYLAKTYVLSLNKDEATELVLTLPGAKNFGAKVKQVKFLLKALRQVGPQIVVVTSGKAGADVYDGKTFYHQTAGKERKAVVDTTGVGDCFHSTFLAGLEKYHGDIKKALVAAAKNSASLTSQVGAQNGLIKIV